MMLRSSSTPVLGSLLTSFTESPNNNHHPSELHGPGPKHTYTPQPSIHHNCSKLSCSNVGSQNIGKSLLPSPSVSETKGSNRGSSTGFRRVQSEGNLEELANVSYGFDEFSSSKKVARRPNFCTLEAIPSFSHHSLGTYYSDEEEDEEFEEEDIDDIPFSVENLVLEEERTKVNDNGGSRFDGEGKMYLASGIGISGIDFVDNAGGGGGGGRGSFRPVSFDRDGGDNHGGLGMEEHYKKMLEGSPGNPLILRNYAQFLYQTKADLGGAEEYYSRAILADPEDGEVLSQYAELIWELHHDKERATNYFERAVQASSGDSHVHAAYARFLWDVEDDEDEEDIAQESGDSRVGQAFLHHGIMTSATV